MPLTQTEFLAAKILVVDDQPANVALLTQLLDEVGYLNVSSCLDPREVYSLHERKRFDLILLDLQMPGMDGFQVIEQLKSGLQDDYLPILVVTAQPTHKLHALQAGAKDFISKPFDLLEVKTRIHNMIEVRLLYNKLAQYNALLESQVESRTTELRESEARYRSLTELASDWYWEQDESMNFTKVYGPVLDMLGVPDPSSSLDKPDRQAIGWNESERLILKGFIAARLPFLNFVFSRTHSDGRTQQFQVSGEPMFSRSCQFIGYRGIGMEIGREK